MSHSKPAPKTKTGSPPPVFVKAYNANDGGSGNYTLFIDSVRSEFAKLAVRYVRNRPVLPQQPNPIKYFHILLQAKDDKGVNHSLTLKFQLHDLYLVAFQTETGKWFRYDDFQIPEAGAESLKIKSTYFDQLGNATIGREPLIEAITYLARYNKDGGAKDRLQVLIVMVCEAIRFNNVSHTFIANLLHNPIKDKAIRLKDHQSYITQFKNWEALSKEVLRYDAYGNEYKGKRHFPGDTFSSFGIKTFEDAIKALSIVKLVEVLG